MNLSYSDRAEKHVNPTAIKLLKLMDSKQSNLSIAVDVTSKAEFLKLADVLGPYICILKTHIDIIEDFDYDLIDQLQILAKKHNYLIFEDRKFADIGNTVKLQYSSGVYHIVNWADITNAHSIPGDGIVEGLKEVGLPKGRALLLLAEMSSAGSLAHGSYTEATIKMAMRHREFCIGFIGQNRQLLDGAGIEDDFIYMTPGVGLSKSGDLLGQQYRTPADVIINGRSDIIIVGRGVYASENVVESAAAYQKAGWDAYLSRLSNRV